MTVAVCDTPSDQKDRHLPGPQAAAATAQWRCEALRPHRSGRRLYCMREAGTAIRQGIHALPAIRTRAERLYASLALRLPTASVSMWCARRSQREAGCAAGPSLPYASRRQHRILAARSDTGTARSAACNHADADVWHSNTLTLRGGARNSLAPAGMLSTCSASSVDSTSFQCSSSSDEGSTKLTPSW